MSPLPFERFRKRFDPRKSIAARLLISSFLAFLLPASVFFFLVQRRLTSLQSTSTEQVAAVRVSETAIRLGQDANFRAEWLVRRIRAIEEAAWSLSSAASLALQSPGAARPDDLLPAPDAHGHVWTARPEGDSMAAISSRAADPAEAKRDLARSRSLVPLMAELRRRRPAIKTVSLWTASGVVRHSPWLDFHRANQESGGELERFVFNRFAKFPEAPPAGGDVAVWAEAHAGPSTSPPRDSDASLYVPVRGGNGALLGAVALEVDARRYVAEAMEPWDPPGDFWFVTDSTGHVISMTPRAAAVLGWDGANGQPLQDAPSPELKRLASQTRRGARSSEEYLVDGKHVRIAAAPAGETGWIFYEGLSREAQEMIRSESEKALPQASFSILKRDVLLLFALLLPAVAVIFGIVSRRITAPVSELVKAAEDIGRGRAVEIRGKEASDELGRLASAVDTMSQRVDRRVETLRRLHQFSRSAYRMTDFKEVLARSAQAIAGFTDAESVYVLLFDRNTNRLEAVLPAWNLTEEHGREAEGLRGRALDRRDGVPHRRALLHQ